MSASRSTFSHQAHIAWAFSALFVASLAALAVGASGFWQDGCFACAPVGPATCAGPGDECSGMVATGAVFVTVLTGLCVLFAIHASGAYRLKGARELDPQPSRTGRYRTILLQIPGLTLLSEGIELTVVGLMTPLQFFGFHGTCAGCPVTWSYGLWGLATYLVAFGAGTAVLGGALTVFGFRRPPRELGLRVESPSGR